MKNNKNSGCRSRQQHGALQAHCRPYPCPVLPVKLTLCTFKSKLCKFIKKNILNSYKKQLQRKIANDSNLC